MNIGEEGDVYLNFVGILMNGKKKNVVFEIFITIYQIYTAFEFWRYEFPERQLFFNIR